MRVFYILFVLTLSALALIQPSTAGGSISHYYTLESVLTFTPDDDVGPEISLYQKKGKYGNIYFLKVKIIGYDIDVLNIAPDLKLFQGLHLDGIMFDNDGGILIIIASGRFNTSCPRSGYHERSVQDRLFIDVNKGTSHWECND